MLRFSYQDLKREEGASVDLVHGRAWLHRSRENGGTRTIQGWWRLSRLWIGLRLMFSRGGKDDYAISITLGWLAFGIILSGFRPYQALPRDGFGRDTGFYLYEDHFVLKLNCDDYSWSSKTGPAHGWSKSWFLLDVLLGPSKYIEGEPGPTARRGVSMPERTYVVDVSLQTDTWKRPRWPFPRRIKRARIEVVTPGGVPIPGKGENSYDCGEDATLGSCAPAESIGIAIASFEESILRRRKKYAGEGWVPEAHRRVG